MTVDDLRAAWLKKAGFEAKKGKKSKRVFFRPTPRLPRPGSRKSPAQRPPAHRVFGYNNESKNFSARKGRAIRAAPLSPSRIFWKIRLSGPRTHNRAARCGRAAQRAR